MYYHRMHYSEDERHIPGGSPSHALWAHLLLTRVSIPGASVVFKERRGTWGAF